MGKRGNKEGSIFPYRNGFAAYVWVDTPTGERKRKWAYGKTREEVHTKWLKLHQEAARGPVATTVPTVESYLSYWMKEVVKEPDFSPLTVNTYGQHIRHHLVPYIGKKKLDKLTARDLRAWVNTLRKTCQCCAQGKDKDRRPDRQRCCAVGKCCQSFTTESNIYEARKVLRSALSNAVREEVLSRNVAALLKMAKPRPKKDKPWTLDEVHQFLMSARADDDPLYAAYVLLLVLGLRKGELLALNWSEVNLDAPELSVEWQLHRINGKLRRRKKTKTEDSEDTMPLPQICVEALKLRREHQERQRAEATEWEPSSYVFTTATGHPVDPSRSFARLFDSRCAKAGVRRIEVHTTRKTCATLLAALDVHPRAAMRVLRHSQIKLTMDLYTQVHNDTTTEALKRLGEKINNP